MKLPPSTALLPKGFVNLGQAIEIAGRIDYPKEWTGNEVDAEWDWRYKHNLDSRAKQMREECLEILRELGDSLEGINEEESLEKCKADLQEEDEKRNIPRQRRENVTVRLRQLLNDGLITSQALLPSGQPIDISEFVWAGENAPEIFETGTVCVDNGEPRAPAPGCKYSETAYVLLDQKETEKAMKGEVPKSAAQSRADIEAKCKIFLKQLMKTNPHQRPDTKYNLYAQAIEKFSQLGNLPRKAFDRAWDFAIAETGAKAWKDPGRPRDN